jgi:hypothetical protein
MRFRTTLSVWQDSLRVESVTTKSTHFVALPEYPRNSPHRAAWVSSLSRLFSGAWMHSQTCLAAYAGSYRRQTDRRPTLMHGTETHTLNFMGLGCAARRAPPPPARSISASSSALADRRRKTHISLEMRVFLSLRKILLPLPNHEHRQRTTNRFTSARFPPKNPRCTIFPMRSNPAKSTLLRGLHRQEEGKHRDHHEQQGQHRVMHCRRLNFRPCRDTPALPLSRLLHAQPIPPKSPGIPP